MIIFLDFLALMWLCQDADTESGEYTYSKSLTRSVVLVRTTNGRPCHQPTDSTQEHLWMQHKQETFLST